MLQLTIENEYNFQLPRKKPTIISDGTYKFVAYLLALLNSGITTSFILQGVAIGCYTAQSMAAAYYTPFLFVMPNLPFGQVFFQQENILKKDY